jgi:hypothetical protein
MMTRMAVGVVAETGVSTTLAPVDSGNSRGELEEVSVFTIEAYVTRATGLTAMTHVDVSGCEPAIIYKTVERHNNVKGHDQKKTNIVDVLLEVGGSAQA